MTTEDFESDKLESAPHPRYSRFVIGQDKVKKQFLQAFNQGRTHHAWLICGNRGIGKATLAWNLTKFLLTSQKNSLVNDGEMSINFDDPAISRIEALSEPHLMLVRKNFDPKTKKVKSDITIDNIRELVEFFEFTSPDGKPRIGIVDSVDDLNNNASNAFLKLLEEPPNNSYFFLISHSPESLLPTIRSRCIAVQCQNLSTNDQYFLLDDLGFIKDDQSKTVVSISRGSVGEAIRLINLNGLELYSSIVDTFRELPEIDVTRILDLASKTDGTGKQELADTINSLTIHFISRLVMTGVKGRMNSEVFPGEGLILNKLAPNIGKSLEWAKLYSMMVANAKAYQESNIDDFSQVFENLVDIKLTAIR